MDEDTITDLKQFITATVSQQITDVRNDIVALDKSLNKKIDDLSTHVADALDASNEAIQMQLKDHKRRITKLEHKATA